MPGRKDSRAARARAEGDAEGARALASPSDATLQVDEMCGARLASDATKTCRKRKGSHTDHPGYGHCGTHGGSTETGLKQAMREMGADIILRYKAQNLRFGGDRNDPSIASLTPEQALLEEVRRSAAMVRFLEERIASWNLDSVQESTLTKFITQSEKRRDHDGLSLKDHAARFLATLPAEDPDSPHHLPALTAVNENTGISAFTDAREWLYLYREERMHLAKVAKMAIDAGVAQRLVSIAEDQGRILASAIRAVLGAIGLSPQQAALVPQVVPPILRAVAQDQPIPSVTSLLGNPDSASA